MKSSILYISLLFFFICNSAFSQCLVNSNFATFCGTQTGDCPTFNSPCLNNWKRSHGTPQIKVDLGPKHFNYVYMWSAIVSGVLNGEGVFASYAFFANHSYKITVTANAFSSTGSFLVYATTGLTEPSSYGCGDPIPVPTTKQYIMSNSPIINGGWQTFSVNFTPTSNYDQLWIYPSTTSTTQYNFNVDYVNACTDCSGVIIYNNGIIPSGNTKSGDIYAGSSAGTGGTGTVTVSSTVSTSLQAVNAIHFEHEFHATVSTANFSAKAIDCSGLNTLAIIRSPDANVTTNQVGNFNGNTINKSFDGTDSLKWLANIKGLLLSPIPENDMITIYPTPSRGIIKIAGAYGSLKNSEIIVVDQSGKEVYQLSNNAGNNIVELDLHFLSDGVYFIKIHNQIRAITKKIVIAR